jgi:nitrate reductase gamma subunit
MFLEIFLFRSLWRNTKATVYDGPKLTYESSKWLWLFGLLFHYSFLVIVIRHMRMFLDPVPWVVALVETGDSLLQIGAPAMYMTDVTIVLALLFLFGRRLMNAQVATFPWPTITFPFSLFSGSYSPAS